MGWINEQNMTDIHIIRQDYAQALSQYATYPTPGNEQALEEVMERRARAVRMINREDGISVRHLAAMFRCTKQTIREILAAEED